MLFIVWNAWNMQSQTADHDNQKILHLFSRVLSSGKLIYQGSGSVSVSNSCFLGSCFSVICRILVLCSFALTKVQIRVRLSDITFSVSFQVT